jgi:hypothetical protein
MNNKNFPTPDIRKDFNQNEKRFRHEHGRFSPEEELIISKSIDSKNCVGLSKIFSNLSNSALADSLEADTQNTGKEGLAGPSELGVYPKGRPSLLTTLGGGYYFIPPIPNKNISEIGKQFFIL